MKSMLQEEYFKDKYSLEHRKQEAQRIKDKYPDRVPVVVEKEKGVDMPDLDKKKYLVPNDLSVGQFSYVIRKRLKLKAEKALYLFTQDGTIPPTSELLVNIYNKHKDSDNFLYLYITAERTFGL